MNSRKIKKMGRYTKEAKRTKYNVIDGDTIRIKRSVDGYNWVRLANFNAPEKGSKGYTSSRNKLVQMLNNKKITIKPKGKSYNRIVADIFAGEKNVAKHLK